MVIVQMLAGPNGSGKSTISTALKPIGRYVNADDIQQYLHCTPLEAAQNAEQVREYCLENHQDFTFETVLSTPRNIDLLRRAKEEEYYIVGFFVLTRHPDINVRRVASRVANGGHDVPEEKIRSRYERSLANLTLLPAICDELYVYDNSAPREDNNYAVIVRCIHGDATFFPTQIWDVDALTALMSGSYCQTYID